MKENMGFTNMLMRMAIAVALLLFTVGGFVKGTLAVLLAILSATLIVTALFGYCPLYGLFGWDTCKRKNKNQA